MIVLWIIFIQTLAAKMDQKVAVDTFVVVKRHEIEFIEPQDRAHDQNRGG